MLQYINVSNLINRYSAQSDVVGAAKVRLLEIFKDWSV